MVYIQEQQTVTSTYYLIRTTNYIVVKLSSVHCLTVQ